MRLKDRLAGETSGNDWWSASSVERCNELGKFFRRDIGQR
jgi:hypothetical protein